MSTFKKILLNRWFYAPLIIGVYFLSLTLTSDLGTDLRALLSAIITVAFGFLYCCMISRINPSEVKEYDA